MKKLISVLAISLIMSALLAIPAQAVEFKAAENISVDTVVNDDYYIAGGKVEINADVNGDLFIAGGDVTVNGNVMGDLMIAGGKVVVKGNISDDLRIFGGQISVSGNVVDDVIVGGGQLDIAKTSVVGGSLVAGAGYLTIDGEVKGDIRGAVGMLMLNGKVGGNVIVTVDEKLVVSPKALVNGDIKYSAVIDMNVPKQSIKGHIEFNKFQKEKVLKEVTGAYISYRVTSYLSALLILLLVVIFIPNILTRAAESTKKDIMKTFGVGVVTMVIGFIGAILLMCTVIGIPLAVLIFVTLVIAGYLAKMFVGAWLASYIVDTKKSSAKHFRTKLFFGIAGMMLVYYAVGSVPFIGWLIDIVLFMVGIGSMVIAKREAFVFLKGKKML